MKRLGSVENLSYDGTFLVRSRFVPGRGARVYDGRKRPLGTVTKVFGPVGEPFASVRPEGKVPLSLLGSEVYIEGDHAERKSRTTSV